MARRSSSRSAKSSKRKRRSKPRTKNAKAAGFTPDRRIDILGILLTASGLITIISFTTPMPGTFTGWWVHSIRIAFGWGSYFLPILLIPLGIWILFRNTQKLPHLSIERVLGVLLIYINLAAWFHLWIDGGFPEAAAGRAGGYLGAAVKLGLERTLGRPGAIIALVAWLLICLIFLFDLSIANLFKHIFGIISSSMDKFIQWAARSVRKWQSNQEKPGPSSKYDQEEVYRQESFSGSQTASSPRVTQSTAASFEDQPVPAEPVWRLPDPDQILEPAVEVPDDGDNDRQRARVIEETLRSFGAPAHVVEIQQGPSVTLFGVEPDFIQSRNGKTRVRVSKITALADDLALALAASRIRIQAPVPGKGYLGIEVPNHQIALVSLNDIMRSPAYKKLESPLKIALGKDVAGKAVAADLTMMPHLLIAGTTGSGKSVCINGILTCLLLSLTPDDLRLVLVDPKRVELTGYNGIPHLLSPVIVDADHVVGALQWITREMDIRYRKFSEAHTRNIVEYNAYCEQNLIKKLPYLLVVIDELADLMMLAPDETERTITRLTQLARATGIHLVIATQRPSTDILTGLIKANFPARIAFAVASSVDSRVILDQPGAERLLGRGDMLFQAPDAAAPIRIQTAFVSDLEINRLTAYWRSFTVTPGAPERPDQPAAFQTNKGVPLKQVPLWEEMEEEKDLDPKFDEAVKIVREESQASVSMLQRKMRIGYTRAARIIDKMEEKGIVSKPDSKTQIRKVNPPSDQNA